MEFFILFAVFIIPFAWTPGPVNVTLAAIGANGGFYKTIPFILGLNFAFFMQSLSMGLGLGAIFEIYPFTQILLRLCASVYLLYLAYQMANLQAKSKNISFGFWNGALMSVFNPKVYITLVAMYTQFAQQSHTFAEVFLLSLLSMLFFMIGNAAWCLLGSSAQKLIATPKYFMLYKVIIVSMLIVVAVFMLISK